MTVKVEPDKASAKPKTAKAEPKPTTKAGTTPKPDGNAQVTSLGDPPSVLVVMGVSGSGKTTVAAMLARELGWTFQDGDWFHPPANVEKMAAGTALTDKDRWPWLQAIADWIDSTRKADHHGVVACSALKREYRAVLVGGHADAVRIVFLDGDKTLIRDRMARREGHYMPTDLLDSQFATLEPPGPDETPITVAVEKQPRDIVDAILRALEAETGGTLPEGP